jgi:hypothetical protein
VEILGEQCDGSFNLVEQPIRRAWIVLCHEDPDVLEILLCEWRAPNAG